MKAEAQLVGLLQDRVHLLLKQVNDAMIVMDSQRQLVYANPAANQLLGFDKGETVSGRCRETTHGTDCSSSCPLSFMLEVSGESVRDFPTVYRRKDGSPVSLQVTIIPLKDDKGVFRGAIEILRPRQAELGFYLCGNSEISGRLRERLVSWPGGDLVLVGEDSACRDLALSLHRSRGLPDELFRELREDAGEEWPPRTLFGWGDELSARLTQESHPGIWRILSFKWDAEGPIPPSCEVLRLPRLEEIVDDLPAIFSEWADRLKPGIRVHRKALDRLSSIALESGLEAAGEALKQGLLLARERLEEEQLPCDKAYRALIWSEFAEAENPLAAVESCFLWEVLEANDWKIQEAADGLKISRVTLWRKMKQYHIQREKPPAPTGGE